MENLTHDLVKFFNPGHRQSTDLNMRVQTGSKKNLIRVDIPNPSDDLLMHQERFEPATSRLQQIHKVLLRCGERIQSKSAGEISIKSCPIQQRQSPKPTGIPVP